MTHYLEEQSEFSDLCELMVDCSICVDTEFVRRNTYFSILSLIQISFNNKIYVVDCLKIKDLSPFFKVLEDPSVKKILHSCFQDLQIFYQASGKMLQNFEDTQILANFCGYDLNIGYSTLVDKFLNKKIDKKLQNSNWLKRPLSKEQINYAAGDVLYLEKPYNDLAREVESRGLLQFYKQEKDFLLYQITNYSDLFTNSFFKKYSKVIKKHKINAALIKDSLILRDEVAKKLNVPRSFIISDDILLNSWINKDIKHKEVDGLFLASLKEIFIKYNNSLDLEVKSCNNFSKEVFEKAKIFLKSRATEIGVCEQFIVSSSDFKGFLFLPDSSKKFTKWRVDILQNIKREFKL